MLVENSFPQDTRVKNEALLLTASGYRVSVVCYQKKNQPAFETYQGIEVHRIPRFELFQKTPTANASWLSVLVLRLKSFLGYLAEYAYFTTACFLTAVRVFLKSGFDAIHAHNPPDTLFLVALPFKLLGKKFVFDHHDLCPELYQSRYGAKRGFYTALLSLFQWFSLKIANVTIATNQTYKAIQIQRARKDPNQIFVVRNGPNQDRMQPRTPSARLRNLHKTILCYIGSLNPQDGVDYLLRSLNHLRRDLKRDDFYCVIMGSGDSLDDLRALSTQLGLDAHLQLTGFIPDDELMENLAAADICVDPDPSSPLNDVSTWIKIMEYMASGKPIVTFDLKETRFSASDSALYVPPNDELGFAKAIALLMDDPELRLKMGNFGRQRVEQHLQWSVTGKHLVSAYQFLFPNQQPQIVSESHTANKVSAPPRSLVQSPE
jgi:glycosyltransferase involved in cell wall biosynthesis